MTEKLAAGRGEGLAGLRRWANVGVNGLMQEHPLGEFILRTEALEAHDLFSLIRLMTPALSLSSPIEPRLADQVSILRTTCDCHIATIEAMQREIDELKAQASSEVREALGQAVEQWEHEVVIDGTYDKPFETHSHANCKRCEIERLLLLAAPSRQGAGGK